MPIGYEPYPKKIPTANERRVIIVLPGDKIEQIRNDKKYDKFHQSIKTSDQTWLMDNLRENYQDPETISFLEKLDHENILDNGNILVQSSEDPIKYFLAEQVENKVVLPKWDHYITICNYLGATSIELDINDVTSFAEKTNFIAKSKIFFLDNLFPKISIKFSKKQKIKLKNRAELKLKKEPPNLDLVKEYVKKYSLEKDADISFIINNRKFNKDLEFKRKINLFSEVETSLNVAASLVIPESFTQIKASFKKAIKETRKYTVTIALDFGYKS
ncbi:hypothetical protein [Moorena bouillonii]|uniref:Uncharacterized protein n=1 Tax=Moorena bouillonii PNG TaxID=568701 RepID=A0A1U7MYV6_9CYAN|nr:hypothetical protein [Moorena bouillonii]OLT58834.1 hypothetical protein BJP37_07010 [Moorena bouillonii PNG]